MNEPYFKPTNTMKRIAAAVCTKRSEKTCRKGQFHSDEEAISKMDGSDLIALWQDRNNVPRFEGGTRGLEQLIGAIGYSDFEDFLGDNPGAQEVIVSFIEEWVDHNPEWKEGIVSHIPESDELDKSEEDEDIPRPSDPKGGDPDREQFNTEGTQI